eukprot:Hpha_TRINITY_DN16243_c0_g4::TRINITY_DN16243_c0_g4_i1::g.14681::m.14681
MASFYRNPLEGVDVVTAVAAALDHALLTPQQCRGPVTVFEADPEHPPQIALSNYLDRWAHHSGAGQEVLVVALAYVQRSGIALNSLTVHRLLLAALVLAAKYRNDEFYTNTYYGVVGGVSLEEVNRLEIALLEKIDWKLGLSSEEFDGLCDKLLGKSSMLELQPGSASDSEDGISSVEDDSLDSSRHSQSSRSSNQCLVSPAAAAPRGKFACIRETSALIWKLCSYQ